MQLMSINTARQLRMLLALLCLSIISLQTAHACTSSSSATITLGNKTSFDVRTAATNAGSGASGLACPGIIGILSNQYIYVSVTAKSSALINSVTGDGIAFDVATTPGGTALTVGATSTNLALGNLLSIGGVNSDVSMFVSLAAASNVAAGTYTGTVSLRWYYATCGSISAVGICIGNWTRSPGINQNCSLGLCTLVQGSLPGTGVAVTVTINLTVTHDCRFDADNINFGSAPFVASFNTVSGNLRITCTKGDTYTVGLSNGNNFSGGRRRMAFGVNYLQYDVLRPGNTIWNSTTQRVAQSTAAAGNAAETFAYSASIYTDQTTPVAGVYNDVLVIDVAF
jgi:spore coat protein U-like protein